MPEVVLIIPGVPRSKQAKSARVYEARVREVALQHIPKPLQQSGLSIEVHHFYTTRNRVDLDNLQKTLFDGLKEAAYKDDDQIDHVTARRYNIDTSTRIENAREEWLDWLAQRADFVSIIIQY